MSGIFDDLFETLEQIDGEVTRLEQTVSMSQRNKKTKKRQRFTEEERLALGLYPKDEGYKMSLISRILGKRY